MVMNVKKRIFGFQITEPIMGQPLTDWLKTTIARRKLNYLVNDSLDFF